MPRTASRLSCCSTTNVYVMIWYSRGSAPPLKSVVCAIIAPTLTTRAYKLICAFKCVCGHARAPVKTQSSVWLRSNSKLYFIHAHLFYLYISIYSMRWPYFWVIPNTYGRTAVYTHTTHVHLYWKTKKRVRISRMAKRR